MHGGIATVSNTRQRSDAERKMRRVVQRAEAEALEKARKTIKGNVSDVGTGQTIIKLAASPIQRLLDREKIGGEEFRAAQDITTAVMSITGALWIKPQETERRDRGQSDYENAAVIDAVERYRRFANHWSAFAKRGHPLLEIVYSAIVDERAFREIEADVGIRNGKAEITVIAGLRDYAARAGWVSRPQAEVWITQAHQLFRLRTLA